MNKKDDAFNPENIRCGLGLMEHTLINMIYTPEEHQSLKNKDPVVIIHKDDFIHIIEKLPDSPLKSKLCKISGTWEQFNHL